MKKRNLSIGVILGVSAIFSAEAEVPPAPNTTYQMRYSTYPTHKVLLLGANSGFIASKLSASFPGGTENDFDILVVGDADKINSAQFLKIQSALNAGKEVVFDAASDGSNRKTHSEIVKKLTGVSIDTAAVRIQKVNQGGFMVTPIEDEQTVAAKTYQHRFTSNTTESSVLLNSADNVFGINNTRGK